MVTSTLTLPSNDTELTAMKDVLLGVKQTLQRFTTLVNSQLVSIEEEDLSRSMKRQRLSGDEEACRGTKRQRLSAYDEVEDIARVLLSLQGCSSKTSVIPSCCVVQSIKTTEPPAPHLATPDPSEETTTITEEPAQADHLPLPEDSTCTYMNAKAFTGVQCPIDRLKLNPFFSNTMRVHSLSEESMSFSNLQGGCRGLGMLRMVIGGLYTVETVDGRMVEVESFNFKGGDSEPKAAYLIYNPPSRTYHVALPVQSKSGTAVERNLCKKYNRSSASGYFLWYVEMYPTKQVMVEKAKKTNVSLTAVKTVKRCKAVLSALREADFRHETFHAGSEKKWVGIESVVGIVYLRSLPVLHKESLEACSARHRSTGPFPDAVYRTFDVTG